MEERRAEGEWKGRKRRGERPRWERREEGQEEEEEEEEEEEMRKIDR